MSSPIGVEIVSRFYGGMVQVFGWRQTDSSHTARLTRNTRLRYPYHPLFRDGTETLEVIGLRSDMIVVRLLLMFGRHPDVGSSPIGGQSWFPGAHTRERGTPGGQIDNFAEVVCGARDVGIEFGRGSRAGFIGPLSIPAVELLPNN